MDIFKSFSLHTKILMIILFSTFSVAFCSTAVLIKNDFPENHELKLLFNDIMNQSSAIASALIDNNQNILNEQLHKLRINPNILTAEVFYYKNGSFIKSSDNVQKEEIFLASKPAAPYFIFSSLNKPLEFMYPIIKQEKTIGALYIKATNTNNYVGLLLEMSILVTLIAIFFAMYLADFITNPLNTLVAAMKKVSSQNDYSIRVKKETEDEVGVLINNFNSMLEKIQVNEKMQRSSEEQIKKLSYYDSLTGLPNRDFFVKLFQQDFLEAKRNSQKLAVLYLALDNFKVINDGLGHDKGDLCLQNITNKLLSYLKKIIDPQNNALSEQIDSIFPFGLARMIEDEFIITIADIKGLEEVELLAKNIINLIQQPYKIKNEEITLTASIGIATFPLHASDEQGLIKNAKAAMYVAKEHGAGQYQFFDNEMHHMISKMEEKARLENDLHSALQNNELILYFQPKYNLHSKKIVGMEALLRWKHPKLGLIPPDEFIFLAEKTGLIMPIGAWVLQEGCFQCKKWHTLGYAMHISINLSPRQFADPMLITTVENAILTSGLDPTYLELELTESTIMLSDEKTLNTLHALKKINVALSIDDFGTGYSSLRYLTRYPIDIVKIDKTFITYLLENKNDATITKTIIDLGHNLNLQVVAEGVETLGQLNFLKNNGCDTIQGYIIARPMPKEEMDTFLLKHGREVYETRN